MAANPSFYARLVGMKVLCRTCLASLEFALIDDDDGETVVDLTCPCCGHQVPLPAVKDAD